MSASSRPSWSMARTVAGSSGRAAACGMSSSKRMAGAFSGAGHYDTTLQVNRLRRLLRRHLLHHAGLQINADAVDLVEIGAGDADETRAIRVVDRMDRAVLVDAGLAGIEAVFLLRLELGVARIPAIVEPLPFDHVGPE